MKNKLNKDINQILNDYKSVNQMLKGNISILKTLQFDQIPELSRAFCLGVVFAEILTHLNAYSYPEPPDEQSMQEANKMFLAFVRGEYEN
jgi:hypothetical protein